MNREVCKHFVLTTQRCRDCEIDALIEKWKSEYENTKHINHHQALLVKSFLKDLKSLRGE